MPEQTWLLHGTAYGTTYNSILIFKEKRKRKVQEDTSKRINFRKPETVPPADEEVEQAVFVTEDGKEIILETRYVGSPLGGDDDSRGNTVCHLHVEGEYVAFALYNELRHEILAHEY